MFFLLLLVTVALLLFWYNFMRPLSHFTKMGVKQTQTWPVFGDQWAVLAKKKNMTELVTDIYNLYPKTRYTGFYRFVLPTLIIKDPQLIKQITIKDFDHFTDHKLLVNADTDPLFGNNLIALKGQRWREMRATLSGTFTSSKMKHMFGILNEAAENFVQHFLNQNQSIIELEMKDAFTKYTNDVIATAAFGIKVDSLAEPENDFFSMGTKLLNFSSLSVRIKFVLSFIAPKLFRLLKLKIFPEQLGLFFRKIIHETIKVREEKGIVRQDMINLLLDARKGIKNEETDVMDTGFATVQEFTINDKFKFKKPKQLTNDDITSQALIFFIAGFETISTALCFGTYELAINKDVQDKLRKEILETNQANRGKLSYENLLNMKYMDMVFSEILRLWPPVPGIDRVCTKPYTIEPIYPDEKPVHLKVGDVLWLPFHGLHRDPKYYSNPNQFNPERFSEESKANMTPYTYVPFGAGPRNCIGSRFAILEGKAMLYHLLLNFELVPTKRTSIPLKFLKTIQVKVDGGVWLGLKRLNINVQQ